MAPGMDLDFDKYCIVGGSPNTVLPSPRHCSKVERKKPNRKLKCGNDLLSRNKGFVHIRFNRYRSASCKTPSRTILPECNEVLKRCSVYQSSQERGNMKKMGAIGGRRKIEFPRSSATAFSFGIVDSLCSSDEDSSTSEQDRSSSLMSLNSESSTYISKPHSSHELLDLPFKPISERAVLTNSRENQTAKYAKRQSFDDFKNRCDTAVRERDRSFSLHKSLSTKLALPHSPSHSESDFSKPSSPKSRFSPIRRMLDPFAKSKLQKSHLGLGTGSTDSATLIEKVSISRNKTLRKSLLHDFSNTEENTHCDSHFRMKECNKRIIPCSPAHLRGLLKLENKHGVPFFEFSVKNPEDRFVAKTWKVGHALNWVYTFHTCHDKRKSNASGLGLKERNKESSVVGQMQVTCSLCAEFTDARDFDNSITTEFVLYDIAQARKNATVQNHETSDETKVKLQEKHVAGNGHNPLAPADLHPNLEIAAILIKVPFEKRESLKGNRGDQKSGLRTNWSSPAKVNVVTSSGNHGVPTCESPGPTRLLDRWKLGGGCDCGGWDMGCPLVVFDNSDIQCAEDHPLVNQEWPWKLFLQGGKEKTPALIMTVTEKGEYEVDFHAQLTTLQAFSICVAILHSTEASIAIGQERDKQLLKCDSLRVFIDEDIKYLIESVTEDEKRKADKKVEGPAQSFVLNPPFSPIARV